MKFDLTTLGKIDGWLIAAAAGWGQVDPTHAKLALLLGGIAGALGGILEAISRYQNKPDPVNGGQS